jgi:DNA-directed RNA polymerase subunit RPC12/RpoP
MSEKDTLHGLNCPQCGGIVPVPEGQLIVHCPYCDLRSFVKGERGLLRYQAPQRVSREQAGQALRKFLTGNIAIAPAAARRAQLNEAFLVYLPFWTVWARVGAWVFGEKRVGSGDDARYEPREMRVVQDMTWNSAACDVGEFGVEQVSTAESALVPFDPETLHSAGMVFEPVGSFSEARQEAGEQFQAEVEKKSGLDRLAQVFVRLVRRRYALVYHPLWVLRYAFRGRVFQVVVDGYSGEVLYGKAPGNTLYRAAALVLGMAFGAFLAIDGPALVLAASDGDGDLPWAALGLMAVGGGIMYAGYRAFRHTEQYEFRRGGSTSFVDVKNALEMVTSGEGLEKWLNRLI